MPERVLEVINSVGSNDMGYGLKTASTFITYDTSVYRTTGMDQIKDIIECGYVRTKGYGARRNKVGERVYWSKGNDRLFYNSKNPIIEAPADKVWDGKQGALHLSELTAIWIYNVDKNAFEDNLESVIASYNQLHPEEQICQDKRQV